MSQATSTTAVTNGSGDHEDASVAQLISDEDLDIIAALPLNGRKIKNVIKTAGLLAMKDEKPLSVGHLNTVLRITKGTLAKAG